MTLVILLWLFVCAGHDWRTQRVPNWLTLPGLAGGVGWRMLHVRLDTATWVMLIGISFAYGGLWLYGALGGADLKIGWALALFNPFWAYVALLGIVAFGLILRLRQRKRARRGVPAVPAMLGGMLVALWLFPSAI